MVGRLVQWLASTAQLSVLPFLQGHTRFYHAPRGAAIAVPVEDYASRSAGAGEHNEPWQIVHLPLPLIGRTRNHQSGVD